MTHPIKPIACLRCGKRIKQHEHAGRPRHTCSEKCLAASRAAYKRAVRAAARNCSSGQKLPERCVECAAPDHAPHRRACSTRAICSLEVGP